MKLPFSFNLKFLFRLLLPGFILSMALVPILNDWVAMMGLPINLEYLVLLCSIVLGWGVLMIDMHIYMLFEGRRYWPGWFKRLMMQRKKRQLKKRYRQTVHFYEQRKKLKAEGKEAEAAEANERYLELSTQMRLYPVDENGKWKVRYPTSIGNLIAAYESYPGIVFGLDSIFYWYRIWMIMDKDLREKLDEQQGLADSSLYVSFSLFVAGLMCLVYALIKLSGWTFISLYLNGGIYLILALLFVLLAYGVYRASLQTHIVFGELFKALFDTYHQDIEVDDTIAEVARLTGQQDLTQASRKEKNSIAWHYRHNYRVKLNGDSVTFLSLEQKEKEAEEK